MGQNALVQMLLFESAKETENKLRWDTDVDGVRFSLYIPKWRVPRPSRVWVDVVPRRLNGDDLPNLSTDDVEADPILANEPIVASVELVKEHAKTIQYRPTSAPGTWEIGQPYIPIEMTCNKSELMRLIVIWDLVSEGEF